MKKRDFIKEYEDPFEEFENDFDTYESIKKDLRGFFTAS